MTEFERELLYQKLALAYVRAEGDVLLQENADLPQVPTPRLDARVQRAIGARRAARWLPGLSLLAAGLLLVVALGRPWVAWEPAAEVPHHDAVPSDGLPSSPGEEAALIALRFELPENLSIESVKEDRGQTVYHLREAQGDDVVLTLEYPEKAGDFSDLVPMTQGGEAVYGVSEVGYHLLAFEKDGLRYELTCKYEMRTIAALANVILV